MVLPVAPLLLRKCAYQLRFAYRALVLSEPKELNVNFQDLESFLADPDPHDLMRIRPRHPNGHFGACIRLVYVPPVYVSGFR